MGVNQSTLSQDDGSSTIDRKEKVQSNQTVGSTSNNNNGGERDKKKDIVVVDELQIFMQSMNINKSQSDLDLMIAIINDKMSKNDYESAYGQLKQFVFVTIESLHKHCNKTLLLNNADGLSTTYNALQSSYHLPSLQKLEDLYQLVKLRCEEAMRSPVQANILNLSLMLSILQQLKSMLVRKIILVGEKDEEEDEGLAIYISYQAKAVLSDCQSIVKDMRRVDQLLPVNNDMSVKIKAVENCFTSLQNVLSSVVQRINQSLQACTRHWQWNTTILEKNRNGLKLRPWSNSKITIPLHNQCSIFVDQIYTLLCERFKDCKLVPTIREANAHLEDLIMNLENNQEFVESIQYLLGVDELVDALSAISDISFKYANFIIDCCPNVKNIGEVNRLKSRIQDIMSNYIGLEAEYFQLSFLMAIYLDDLGQLIINLKNKQMGIPHFNQVDKTIRDIETSSKVEDLFFMFRKVVQRSLSTQSAPSACSIINQTSSNFDIIYLPYLQLLLKQTYSGDFDEKRDYFLVILNDFTLTIGYIDQMQAELKAMTERLYKNEDEQKMIISCIHDEESFASLKTRLEALRRENIEKINHILSVPINQLVWPFRNTNYEITDQDYERYQINDPFVQDFIQGLDNLLSPYKKNMVDTNFDKLIHLIAGHISQTLEVDHIKEKRFNYLGALQLSNDIRKIIDHLCNLTSEQNVRHKFTRLSQIVHLLTLDKPSDVQEYWGQEGYTWKLKALEIKLILARRSDFDLKSVHNLVLK